jgi:hypothetical protein
MPCEDHPSLLSILAPAVPIRKTSSSPRSDVLAGEKDWGHSSSRNLQQKRPSYGDIKPLRPLRRDSMDVDTMDPKTDVWEFEDQQPKCPTRRTSMKLGLSLL